MNQEKVDFFLMTQGEKFPEDKKLFLRERLLAMDDSKWMMVSSFNLKNPTTMLIISVFLGSLGIDRFMLGDVGLGILKLITCGGCGIWAIIDWFLISNKTREDNYKKIQPYL